MNTVDFVPFFDEIHVDDEIEPGELREVTLHDGSRLMLKKIEEDYDPSDTMAAVKTLHDHAQRGEVLTGVFYVNTEKDNFIELLNLHDAPLWQVSHGKRRPATGVGAVRDHGRVELALFL